MFIVIRENDGEIICCGMGRNFEEAIGIMYREALWDKKYTDTTIFDMEEHMENESSRLSVAHLDVVDEFGELVARYSIFKARKVWKD